MNMIEATKLAFEKAFDYESRASRSEYWWYQLSYLIITIIAEVVGYALGLYDIIYYIAEVAFFVPAISLAVRRLHDIGMSGWWNLIALTIIGLIPLFIWLVTPGHKGTNRFGTNPLEGENKQNFTSSGIESSTFSTSPVTRYSDEVKKPMTASNNSDLKKTKTKTPKGFKIIKKLKD